MKGTRETEIGGSRRDEKKGWKRERHREIEIDNYEERNLEERVLL